MPPVKIHIAYKRKEHQIIALRAQALIAVSGITCSVDQKKIPGKSWERIYITERGLVKQTRCLPLALSGHICRMIEALLLLKEYGDKHHD
jgi:hypothetical protein